LGLTVKLGLGIWRNGKAKENAGDAGWERRSRDTGTDGRELKAGAQRADRRPAGREQGAARVPGEGGRPPPDQRRGRGLSVPRRPPTPGACLAGSVGGGAGRTRGAADVARRSPGRGDSLRP
jgi:hypothetical protein